MRTGLDRLNARPVDAAGDLVADALVRAALAKAEAEDAGGTGLGLSTRAGTGTDAETRAGRSVPIAG